MVLRRRQKNGVLAVDKREDRTFLAVEKLLDQHFRAGRAKLVSDEHVVDCRLRVLRRLRDDHALACRESVGLDDDWEPERRKRRLRRSSVGEHLGLAGRNARGVHDFLRKALRALHARARRDRPERRDAYALKSIHKPLDERRLRTHDDEIGVVYSRPRRNALDVVGRNRHVRRDSRGSSVTRGAV